MPGRPFSNRVPAEDSDTESDHGGQQANQDRDEGLRRLQELDLGTYRAGRLKQDDRRMKHEDKSNVRQLLEDRDACQEGTEAHKLYTKNKSATAAWNNPSNVIDNHEEDFDTLDGGNAHRQRMRNEHGGRVEEPTEWEAGYGGGGRGRGRGSFAARGGRGSAAPPPSRAPAPSGSRAGILPRSSPYPTRSTTTPTANYRPLDPALTETNDPRSKYGKAPTRGGLNTGRGGGNVGRGIGRTEFNVRTAPPPARSRAPLSDRENRIDTLADPAAFMRAVGRLNPPKQTKNKSETIEIAKTTEDASSSKIESKWEDIGSGGPPRVATTQPTIAVSAANIRQVPTGEFALPHPHRGDTDSWTDGIPSDLPSGSLSTGLSSHRSIERAPSVDESNLIGLGIQGVATSNGNTAYKGNTADGINLMDAAEDLTILQEAPKPRAPLAKRIFVNGAWYTLDESALGNAASQVDDLSTAPPPEPTPSQGEWKDKPKKPGSATSTSSIIGDRNGNVNGAVQTTPSLNDSRWATPAPTSVVNPFLVGVAPPRTIAAQVQSLGEYITFAGHRLHQAVPVFLKSELTSPGVESAASTPSLTSSIWGQVGAKVTTSRQKASNRPASQGFAKGVSTSNAGHGSQPAVIDKYDLVRLQAVGNASFGMTPFRGTSIPSEESTPPTSARPIHTRHQSTTTNVTSNGTASSGRARGLNASKYASGDVSSASTEHLGLNALQGLSLNNAPRSNTISKPPKSTLGTASSVSGYALHHDENTPPNPSTTSLFGRRPILRPTTRAPRAAITSPGRDAEYQPISTTRHPAGDGAIVQPDIAAAALAANSPAPQSTNRLIPPPSAFAFHNSVTDDGYESEL